jgi:D-3-phosphoglycerate dehydrogenase
VTRVVVTPNRFPDLEPERTTLEPLGVEVAAAADEADLHRLAPEAVALLVTSFVNVDSGLVRRLGRCRAIVRYGIGVDEVDVAAATRAGIPVGNVVDASVNEVADHAVMLALACLRRLSETQRALADGSWDVAPLRGARRLSGLTAGIVGLGRIGRAVARRLEAFDMRVVAYDPFVEEAPYPLLDLDELLRGSHLVSVHLPLTDGTRGLLSDEKLGLLAPGSVIVNVARGGIVDESALARRLEEGSLWGAGLDVFAREPLPRDDPIRDAPHAVLTPHVAWYSVESTRELQWRAAEQVARVLRGERLDPVVNPSVYAGAAS